MQVNVAVAGGNHSAIPSKLSSLLQLHFVYSDFSASQTPLHIVSVFPRALSHPSASGSSAPHSLLLLAFSVSFTVPRCSLLRARVRILQVNSCPIFFPFIF
jgi:hypothetical protein